MKRHITYANVTATLALVFALGLGSAEAVRLSQGPRGPRGARGAQGPAGAEGRAGPEGQWGVRGQVGPTGERGPMGPRGQVGPEGKEASTAPFAHHCNAEFEVANELTAADNKLSTKIAELRAKAGPPVGPTGFVTGAELEIAELKGELRGKEAVEAALLQVRAQANC